MFNWLKKKFRREQGYTAPAAALPEATADRAWTGVYDDARELREELERERTARATAEDTLRKYQFKEQERASAEAKAAYEAKVPPRDKTYEEILSKLPEKERKKYQKRIREGERSQVEAEMEVWEAGIPGYKRAVHRDWIPESTDVEGKRVPGHYEYREVKVPMSPQERLAEARVQKLGSYEIEERIAGLKQQRRERSLPVRAARAVGGFGQLMAGTAMMGVAGTAQAVLPRGEPRRARGLVPSLPIGLYGVSTPGIDLSGLKGYPRVGVGLGGLGYLRSAVLPRMAAMRLSRTPLTAPPRGVDLSGLKTRINLSKLRGTPINPRRKP